MPLDFAPGAPPIIVVEHATVLSSETIDLIAPVPGAIYVDATLGAGGHAEALLEREPKATVIGFDRDANAIEIARERLARFGEAARLVHAPFSELAQHLAEMNVGPVDGILADLGISSLQLGDAARGMSFRSAGPIDMRMDRDSGETALELIERSDTDELADVIYQYGDERRSRRIARCIHNALQAGELATTLDLRRAVVRAVGPARVGGVDPATRTFQALRIAVNGELDELNALLALAPDALRGGGTLAVISFHSLEDRQVKRAFLDAEIWQRLTRKPVVPSSAEQERNPRSRSAKLRAAKKVSQ
ncbi:MAG TPA: 16S rRNA (cytosine(1402)-N(4))-methyltransferase RsmH [Polyangiaceae bacterium]